VTWCSAGAPFYASSALSKAQGSTQRRSRTTEKRWRSARRNVRIVSAWRNSRQAAFAQDLMPKASTIRGLERGLQVLKLLQAGPPAALQDLHAATGLPKPSLLRVLATLEHAGLVHRRIDDGRYRPSFKQVEVSLQPRPFDRVAEAATPVLDRLCRKIVWPSDLAVPADDHMEICETSRTLSPFSFNSARVGNRINWLMTGLGRAYLAFCPEEERQRVVTRLRDTGNPQDRLASQPSRLDAILAETRERGYGMRDPAFYGGFYERPFDDQLAGIAVPLGGGDHVYGSINILWVRRAMTVGEIVAHHLADLQTAAAEIVSMLA
jgi:IclR family transcriptional regulator, mhp operon transcriptional activator